MANFRTGQGPIWRPPPTLSLLSPLYTLLPILTSCPDEVTPVEALLPENGSKTLLLLLLVLCMGAPKGTLLARIPSKRSLRQGVWCGELIWGVIQGSRKRQQEPHDQSAEKPDKIK